MNLKNKVFKILFIVSIISIIFFNINIVKANELNEVSDETISLSIGSINIENYEGSKEVSIPITINNAKSLCGGTLHIQYIGNFTYIGSEKENPDYMFAVENDIQNSEIIISFSGSKEKNGKIDLLNLKFALPEKVENEQTYTLQFTKDTSLLTMDVAKYKYELNNGKIYIKNGNSFSKHDIIKIVAIGLGVIILLSILIVLIKKAKSRR